jgi:hypothetical protein
MEWVGSGECKSNRNAGRRRGGIQSGRAARGRAEDGKGFAAAPQGLVADKCYRPVTADRLGSTAGENG